MLRFPGLFLLLALIAGCLGFGELAGSLAEFFKTLSLALVALAALGCILNRTHDSLDTGDGDADGAPERSPGD